MISYGDDGYIKTKLSVTLQVLTEFKVVFKEEINVTKTTILPVHGVTHQAAFDVAHSIITTSPTLTHLRTEIAFDSFLTEVGITSPRYVNLDDHVRIRNCS